MHFSKIYLQDNFVPNIVEDQFRRKVIGIEITLNEGENMADARLWAEDYIKDYIKDNTVYPDHNHIEERIVSEPLVLPSIQVQREKVKEDNTIREYVKEIEKITDLKELKSWEAISKLHLEVKKAYEMKWIILQADGLLPKNSKLKQLKKLKP